MKQSLRQRWIPSITSIYCSTEQKAIEGAAILAQHLSLSYTEVHALGENDRSSTGFLPPDEFELVADEFFANPGVSVRGWERAVDAQTRIRCAVESLVAQDQTPGAIAIVSHGAVGTLLYCALSGIAIDRRHDQPANGGGNYFSFTVLPSAAPSWWLPIDQPAT